jgi:hypothetical protein
LKSAVARQFHFAAVTLDPGLFNEHALTLQKYGAWIGACTVAKPTDFAGKGFSTEFPEFLVKDVVEEPLRGASELILDEVSNFLVDIFDDVE